tara:strand:+ start:136 stop:342 length:207 start_codon:yes stop_codon:yes gene_type:complete
MKLLMKLGGKIEDSKRVLFNQGYSYDEAREMVELVFNEKGLKMTGFDMEIEIDDIKAMITHLNLTFNL